MWGPFTAYCYRSILDGIEHIAMVKVCYIYFLTQGYCKFNFSIWHDIDHIAMVMVWSNQEYYTREVHYQHATSSTTIDLYLVVDWSLCQNLGWEVISVKRNWVINKTRILERN